MSAPDARSPPMRAFSSRAAMNVTPSRNGRRRPPGSLPQYDGLRVSVRRSPVRQAPGSTRNGPVPAEQRVAGVAQAGPCLAHDGLTIPNDGDASVARNGAYPVRSVNTTVD